MWEFLTIIHLNFFCNTVMIISIEIFQKIKEGDKKAFEKFVKTVAESIHSFPEIKKIAHEFSRQNLSILSTDVFSFYLNHEDKEYRRYACYLAGLLTIFTKNKELYDMLEKRVDIETDPFIFTDLVTFLVKSGIKSTTGIFENRLLKLLEDSNSVIPISIVCEALFGIGAIAENKPHVLQILTSRMIQSQDDMMTVIRFIQREIASTNPVFSQIVSILLNNLSSPNVKVRALSLLALAHLLGSKASEYIKKALYDPNDEVKLSALSALEIVGEQVVSINEILSFLKDAPTSVAMRVANVVISAYGESGIVEIINLLALGKIGINSQLVKHIADMLTISSVDFVLNIIKRPNVSHRNLLLLLSMFHEKISSAIELRNTFDEIISRALETLDRYAIERIITAIVELYENNRSTIPFCSSFLEKIISRSYHDRELARKAILLLLRIDKNALITYAEKNINYINEILDVSNPEEAGILQTVYSRKIQALLSRVQKIKGGYDLTEDVMLDLLASADFLGERSLPHLKLLLEDANPLIRRLGLWIIKEIHTKKSVLLLIDMLKDKYFGVRIEAVKSLTDLITSLKTRRETHCSTRY